MNYNGQTYLRAEHLLKDGRYRPVKVTISGIVEKCPVKKGDQDGETIGVAFEKSEKILGLNKTNYSLLCWVMGEGNHANWVGKQVTLVVRLIRNKKLFEPAIRVWPDRPHPNARVREQMGEEIKEDWYTGAR
jgi:hypothetical protein